MKNRSGIKEVSPPDDTMPEEERYALLGGHKKIIDSELRKWALGFVKLRWFVPLLIIGVALAAWGAGFVFNLGAVIGVGLFTLLYNSVLYLFARRFVSHSGGKDFLYFFTYSQVGLDYASVFYLVHMTGGVTSPLIFFFFFHIIFAAILLPMRSAFGFAGLASAGMVLLAISERSGVISHTPLCFMGDTVIIADKPWYLAILLSFFITAIFISALSASLIMGMLRKRIIENVAFYEQAEKQAVERWRFMRKAAHNLRAPLAAVMSMLEVLKEDYFGPLTSPQREHIRRVYRRTRTMAAMIEKLMTIAKSRTGMRPSPPRPMALIEMSGRITRTFEDVARKKGLEFIMGVPTQLAETLADLDVVEPVLENLISNAIKYTMSGKVIVTFATSDQFLKLTVKDTGIGIPESDKPHLFKEFFRSKNAKTVEEVGTGLGLALIKETVSQKRGHIELESTEGVGTRFDVYLPMFTPSAIIE